MKLSFIVPILLLAGDKLCRPDYSTASRAFPVRFNVDKLKGTGLQIIRLIFHVFGALAEFERDLIRERTQAGLAAARARGRRGGRPRTPSLNDARKVAIAQSLYDDRRNMVADICKTLHISRSTLYRYISVRPRNGPRKS